MDPDAKGENRPFTCVIARLDEPSNGWTVTEVQMPKQWSPPVVDRRTVNGMQAAEAVAIRGYVEQCETGETPDGGREVRVSGWTTLPPGEYPVGMDLKAAVTTRHWHAGVMRETSVSGTLESVAVYDPDSPVPWDLKLTVRP